MLSLVGFDKTMTIPRFVFTLLIFALILLFILIIGYVLFLKYDSLPSHLPSIGKRHPILIIDDDPNELEMMADRLAGGGYDITKLPVITDARLTESFGIVICDIDGAGPVKDSIAVIKSIIEDYPYKIIYPISRKQQWDGLEMIKIINKRSSEHLKLIPNLLDDAMKKLNNPRDYWESVAATLKSQHRQGDIPIMKQQFREYLESLQK
ncbi:MAG: hypothetical protein HDS06_07795 [Bacteroides sp.]|nr:hypothetical protein [Bacteroides sp.]